MARSLDWHGQLTDLPPARVGRSSPSPLSSLQPAKLALIPTLVGLNLVVSWIVKAINLPIYLDSIGITVAAILAGPWVAAIVGIATTLLGSTFRPSLWAFTGTAIVIGLISAALANAGFYTKWWKALIAGFVVAICAAIMSAPVAAYVFGGATASGIDAVTLAFRAAGKSVLESVFLSGFSFEPVDKLIVALVAFGLTHSLSRRTLAWFPGAERRIHGEPQPGGRP